MSQTGYRLTRPRGMDSATWRAFCRAWSYAGTQNGRTTALRDQLCREYGLSPTQAKRYVKRGVGMAR